MGISQDHVGFLFIAQSIIVPSYMHSGVPLRGASLGCPYKRGMTGK